MSTAIRRTKISTPMQWLWDNGYIKKGMPKALDYGCGYGFDANFFEMFRYDPHWSPDARVLIPGFYNVVTCNYVLNVLPKTAERIILWDIIRLLEPTGTAFVSVRNDIFEDTKTQRVVNLDYPLLKTTRNFKLYQIKGISV